jgi:hypothetical protein
MRVRGFLFNVLGLCALLGWSWPAVAQTICNAQGRTITCFGEHGISVQQETGPGQGMIMDEHGAEPYFFQRPSEPLGSLSPRSDHRRQPESLRRWEEDSPLRVSPSDRPRSRMPLLDPLHEWGR